MRASNLMVFVGAMFAVACKGTVGDTSGIDARPRGDAAVFDSASTSQVDGGQPSPGTPPDGGTRVDAAHADAANADAAPNGPAPDAGTGGMLPPAGNPNGSCTSVMLPSDAVPVDTTHPTTVVGNGTPASCTFDALTTAVSRGGVITFDCGGGITTIPVTTTLTPPTSNAYAHETPVNTVIDGGNKITLDGGGMVRIISWNHAGSWRVNNDTLTLQHIRIANGKTTPTSQIPPCPPAGGISNMLCSQGYDDGEGGALFMRDGMLKVFDSTFENNQAALLGPDTGGGALYILGTLHPAYIVGSTFSGNKASNAGGVGMLWAGALIINSLFDGNSAVGTGANNNDPSKCTCMNNGQNQVGSGGNGGAIYKDGGDGVDLTICGTQIRNNTANEFGPAIFLTADGSSAKLVIDDSLLENNATPIPYWQWCTGVSTDNPHMNGSTSSSPSPVNTSFCGANGSCMTSCSS